MVAALALSLLGLLVTRALSVPLNDQLARAGDPRHLADLATVRNRFEAPWIGWNVARTVLTTAAVACLGRAILLQDQKQTLGAAAYGTEDRRGRWSVCEPSVHRQETWPMSVTEVEHLRRRYVDTVAATDASLAVEEGEVFGILGIAFSFLASAARLDPEFGRIPGPMRSCSSAPTTRCAIGEEAPQPA